ncbi:aldehyde dehydrogenase [Shewanella inventionis]|jgi:acyl-CoA reductase-like NAD-dependent aldehyde dehydrogenase|uniref:Salicylaldehyde dehydrogenase n=1 Tax=Shewanella inventionis TaxID=1738770 RepID=A0ABQ1JQK8_9GAMM|nr:aldehyde dehydrogenase [Shewanella inventionis]MCL1159790.1 aldehyde dehydrogenase [Shewanella inventionis]GGB75068.1 salicylaldehyde dehydrogenase [Shewanella inventionis]
MQTKLIINNEFVDSENKETFDRYNETIGEVVTSSAAASVKDANHAAEVAQKAFESWSQTGPSERRNILLKAADILESKTAEFIDAMAKEVGSSSLWAGFNVMLAANVFREAACLATQIQGETIPSDKPGTLSMTIREPVGVILSIAPWNGPIVLAARAIAYPIVCGNSVVFKASEISPKTHSLVVEAVIEAGLPAGVLNLLSNKPEDGESIVNSLIEHKNVRRINFTGSTRVGRFIAQKAGYHLKRCLLELGGKSPQVILDDADLKEAAKAATFGSFLYQGQICMTTGRIIVDESVADEFSGIFAKLANNLPAGNPCDGNECVVGPLVTKGSAERLNGYIDDALSKGAKLITGGKTDGTVMKATILDHVTSNMEIYHEESFGPLICIVRVKDANDALRVANDTPYGLSAAVFGKDVNRALQMAKNIKAGHCHVNGSTVQNDAQAPYGGTKDSGWGRFDGRAVIDEFTELKWITIEPIAQDYPI